MRHFTRAFFILSFLTAVAAVWVHAESSSYTAVRSIPWPLSDAERPIAITIVKNTSQVLRFDRPVARVAVSDPKVCDIATVGEADILVNSKESGVVNLLVWDRQNNVATFTLESILDVDQLSDLLLNIDPTADLKILPFQKSAAIYGTAETASKLKQLGEASKAFDPGVLSFIKLKESKQVLLEVRFAEVDRKLAKDFKIDMFAIFGYFNVSNFTGGTGGSKIAGDSSFSPEGGVTTYSSLPAIPTETVGNLPISYITRSLWLQNWIKWLETKSVLKIIARPNLVAKDGEEAEFKVGGEFPVPFTSTNGSISISYKEFGTTLKFTPEVLDDSLIRLKMEAEVSELDFTTGVTSGGVTVPGLAKRTQRTVAELHENETLIVSGLIFQKLSDAGRKLPYAGDVPFLGKLFSNKEFSHTEQELLVTITPHIIRPVNLEEAKILYDSQKLKESTELLEPPFVEKPKDKPKQKPASKPAGEMDKLIVEMRQLDKRP